MYDIIFSLNYRPIIMVEQNARDISIVNRNTNWTYHISVYEDDLCKLPKTNLSHKFQWEIYNSGSLSYSYRSKGNKLNF